MKVLKKLTVLLIVLGVFFSASTANVLAATKTTKFKDIPNNYWAKKEIDSLVSLKIIGGYPDGTFKPNKTMTRGEVAIMIGKALNISTKNRPNPNFTDVTTKDSAYPYIAALVQEGVFSKGKKFNPSATLTRTEMAKILVEAFDVTGTSDKVYKDVPKTHWAYPYVTKLVGNRIASGTSASLFGANGQVTRVQMTVFVKKAIDYKKKVSSTAPGNDLLDLTIAKAVLAEVNKERAKVKVAPLKLNVDLTTVAQAKAQDMYDNDYFAHNSPKYGDITSMLKQFGIDVYDAAENLAKNQDTAEEVVADWMTSPGHRANILDPYGTDLGVGMVKGDKGTYWVQVFIHK